MTTPPKFAVGFDGNYFVVGDIVRHSSDYIDLEKGKPCEPATVEKIYVEDGVTKVRVRYPKWMNPDPNGWPQSKGGGSIISPENFFKKLTREERMAEMFMEA
jgi:hypothetical protein